LIETRTTGISVSPHWHSTDFAMLKISPPSGWTTLALVGALVLHVDRMPLWVSALGIALLAWRMAASARAIALTGKFTRAFVAFALVGTVFAFLHTLNGLQAGT